MVISYNSCKKWDGLSYNCEKKKELTKARRPPDEENTSESENAQGVRRVTKRSK